MFKAMLSFDYQRAGWQELYWLPDSVGNHQAALPYVKIIAWGRTLFFGTGVNLRLARAISDDAAKDALTCALPYPLGPNPLWNPTTAVGPDGITPPQDDQSAVMLKFETSNGQWANRYWRGCPDHWVANKTLQVPSIFTPDPTGSAFVSPDPAATPAAAHSVLCTSFLLWLINNTVIRHKVDNTPTYAALAFQFITATKVTDRNSGRGFGLSRGRRPRNSIA